MSHDELLARQRAVMPVWQALYYEEPIALVRGEGRHVWDSEGNRYLDFFGGILTTMSGHNVPEIVEAVREQAGRILHTSTLYMNEQTIELAETIARLSPVEDAKVFFVSSGTEANDAALLLATSFRRSNQVLAMRNSYHGRSFSSVAITGNRAWSPTSVSGLSVGYVHGAYMYRSPFKHLSERDYIRACVDDLRDVIVTQTAGDVACLIAEPIQGVGGFATPPDGLYAAMKEVLDEYGILFVSDEVQTGWGRTGEHFWGIEAHGVSPNLVTFAKGVGNGLAIGGVIGRADIMDALAANSISTFGGNPLATAGALANIRYLLDNDLQANAAKVGDHMLSRLRDAAYGLPVIGDVRGKGLMIGIELVNAAGDPDMGAAQRVMEACKRGGLIVGRGGLHGNVLRVAPPLSVTIEEADEALDVLAGALGGV
ncbi:MAG: aspartate aminotransferase family protein [Actinomycetota bacterium]